MQIKSFLSALVWVTVMGQSLAMTAQAQSSSNVSTFDMKAITCKDLMLSNSENQELMMSLFQGFFSGRSNETLLDIEELATVTDQVRNYCLNNPNKTLMSAFEQYRGEN
ncbi:MAG: HdeA/HdeB family chaperone [Microcystaceae cyanobacterium]